MRLNKRRTSGVLIWLIALPACAIAIANLDITRLALGAFGPASDVMLERWLVIAIVIAAIVLWARLRSPSDGSRRWKSPAAVLLVCIVSIVVVVMRQDAISTRHVEFPGEGITIAATVYLPRTTGRRPAVVFVNGSAPFKRGFYALWAEHLARDGIVAIVPDKSGVGGTGGEFERNNNASLKNLELLAGDVVSALRFAPQIPEVDTTRLGLFGLSQAGWIAPMAAVRSKSARFIIMITGPTVSVREEGEWSDLRGDDQRAARYSLAAAEAIVDTIPPGGVDARTRLGALTIPGLWLFGAKDNSIPTRKSVRVLDSLRQSGHDFQAAVFQNAGHLVFTREGALIPRVAPASWDSISTWIAREIH